MYEFHNNSPAGLASYFHSYTNSQFNSTLTTLLMMTVRDVYLIILNNLLHSYNLYNLSHILVNQFLHWPTH